LHVLGDLLGSVAAIISGVVIYFWGWLLIDPIVSVFICTLIIVSSIRLLKEALHIIMEGVPGHLNLKEVGEAMARANDKIQSVHDLHIWTLTSGTTLLTAHVVLTNPKHWPKIIDDLREAIQKKFGITHVTLQTETQDQQKLCVDCKNQKV